MIFTNSVFQAVYFLYGTKDCLVQECKDLDKRIEVQGSLKAYFLFQTHLCMLLSIIFQLSSYF